MRKLHYVRWVDSSSPASSGWLNTATLREEDAIGVVECATVGFLIEKTKKHIVLAGSTNGKQCSGVMTIPLCCIKEHVKVCV